MTHVAKRAGVSPVTSIGKLSMMVVCLAVLVGVAAPAQAEDEMKQFTTKELQAHLRKTEKELKNLKDLEKKLTAAARQSSNSAREKVINKIDDQMAECILRREDDLGQEHTIKRHGDMVTSGTTGAAEVGAPVGTRRGKKSSLMYKEGIAGMRLRQLARLQGLYVSANHNMRQAIEKQGDSLERYADGTRRFREELERAVAFINDELERRQLAQEAAAQDQ
jgi:hypothetical protein